MRITAVLGLSASALQGFLKPSRILQLHSMLMKRPVDCFFPAQPLKAGVEEENFDAQEFNEALKSAGQVWGKTGTFSSPDPDVMDGIRAEQVRVYSCPHDSYNICDNPSQNIGRTC